MLDYLRIALAARIKSERGASAVEYGLLVVGVCLVLAVASKTLGVALVDAFKGESSRIAKP
jgi:pilus assembly protein Flp/PilA